MDLVAKLISFQVPAELLAAGGNLIVNLDSDSLLAERQAFRKSLLNK